MSRIIPATFLDELMMLYDCPRDPITIHQELRVTGTISSVNLREALASAARHHPMTRARLLPQRLFDTHLRWAIEEEFAVEPVEEVWLISDAEIESARDSFVSTQIPVDKAPAFRCLIIHHPDGDRIIFNMMHQIGDGLGMLRFIRSVQRAYAGEEDILAGPALDAARDLDALFDIPDKRERQRRFSVLKKIGATMRTPPSRFATSGNSVALPSQKVGQHCIQFSIDGECLRAAASLKGTGSTLNDVLIAIYVIACDRWNSMHGIPSHRISLLMPMSMRPAAWKFDVVSNFLCPLPISIFPAERASLRDTVAAVTDWTRQFKDTSGAGLPYWLRYLSKVPLLLKRVAAAALPDRVLETVGLSNLGVVASFGDFGATGGRVMEFWFSPPTRSPMGPSIGVGSYDGKLFFSFRCSRAVIDQEAGIQFANLYRRILLEGDANPS